MFTIVESLFCGSFLFAATAFIFAIWRLQTLSAFRRVLVGGLFACAAFMTLMILAVTIFVCDVGLGPDAVEVDGIDALVNCWDGVVLAVVVGAIPAAFGIILATNKEKIAKRLRQIGIGLICLCLVLGGGWIACQARLDSIYKSDLKPNVFSTAEPKCLVDSGYQFGFDAREALIISNWISTNQEGWEFGSDENFGAPKTQFLGDNYIIQIDKNEIFIQYYKGEADLTNDPSGDSYIFIKRPLLPAEQAFWATQINQIKATENVEVQVP